MKLPRLAAIVAAAAAATLTLSACAAGSDPDPTSDAVAETTTFRIASGVDNPLEGGVVGFVRDEVAADYGITIETLELQDSRVLTEALANGEIDGHVAIHAPFLDIMLASESSWDLVAAVPLYTSLVSLASTRHSSIDDLPDRALIAIPDDPVNGAAALNVLQAEGILTLDDSVAPSAYTVEDIVDNPKSVQFVPAGAAQLARSIDDADLAFLPTSFLRAAGYDESVEVVTRPMPDEYAIQLVVRTVDADSGSYDALFEAFADPRVADFVEAEFGDIATGIRR